MKLGEPRLLKHRPALYRSRSELADAVAANVRPIIKETALAACAASPAP